MDNIREKVKLFFVKYNLLTGEFPILVAFSGGYDSMCLLDAVSNLTDNIIAIHLNHNWRGEESDREELSCKEFCSAKNIRFYSEKLSSGVKKTETAAREARYEFFRRCAQKYNSSAVLTAHNANDNAETLIYRIAKGTGLKGLCGISEVRDIYYRPLLDIKRDEIEEYCMSHNLSPNSDSSNENTDYKRNLIRKNILPLMAKITPAALDMINSLSNNAKLDNEIIEEYLKTLVEPYSAANFLNYSRALQTRLIYELFDKNGIEPDRGKIERAVNFVHENKVSKSGKTLSVSEKFFLFANCIEIKFIEKTPPSEIEIAVTQDGEYNTPEGIFYIEKCTSKPAGFPPDSCREAYADLSGYSGLTLRTRLDGDIIKPLGAGGSQKLKKYLNEKKVPPYKKDKLLFLASGKEILWAPGLGISENIKVVTNPTHMLKFDIKEN